MDPGTQNLMLMSMRNAALYNAPLEQQVDIYNENNYVQYNGEPVDIYGIATVTYPGRGRVRNTNLTLKPNTIVTQTGEIYPILGRVFNPDPDDPSFYYATIYKGELAGLGTVLFDNQDTIINPDPGNVPLYSSVADFEFIFKPTTPLSETDWAYDLFEGR